MQTLHKSHLFRSKRDLLNFLALSFAIFCISVSFEFYKYQQLTKFDSNLCDAVVLKQYEKTKLKKNGKIKRYQILKLRSDDGYTFYTTASSHLHNLTNKKIQLEIWAGKIDFYQYLKGFFCFSRILKTYPQNSLKNKISTYIDSQHKNKEISSIYKALFLAIPIDANLQKHFSNLGISHLIAISGFHLGVISFILFFLIKYPYSFIQKRFFPYRSAKLDTFVFIALLLLVYLIFLDYPPSLLRAYAMFIIGFILYERGVEIISMEVLFATTVLLLAIFVKLIFSIGFYLSIAGVFYIFLYFLYFKNLSKTTIFFTLPIWIYLMMLPISLTIFGNFSIYHPLSIVYSVAFSIFYPLSILLHIFGIGYIFDDTLKYILQIDTDATSHTLNISYLFTEVIISFISLFNKKALYVLIIFCIYIIARFMLQFGINNW